MGQQACAAIVGLGASAGGLEALEQVFAVLPPDTGMAFVVITHTHAGQPSLLPEILGRITPMPVVEVRSAQRAEPNHVYLTVPGSDLTIRAGVLAPAPPEPERAVHLPIDRFFRCLAEDQGECAAGVVLSGTGSDGTLGVSAIKAALGLVVVQDEATAAFAGMPHSAVASGHADHVLAPAQIPAALMSWVSRGDHAGRQRATVDGFAAVFDLLRERTGHDFSAYKTSTIERRVERRMAVHQLATHEAYVQLLRQHPREIDALFRELLIGVTSFFRDPEAFDALAEALPGLIASRSPDHVLRIWVPGCSTGEEAYSLAILLNETLERLGRRPAFQLFATDLDPRAIDVARSAVYPLGIASTVAPGRLTRFFAREGERFRVGREIRDAIVFATHNLTSDPPFTKLDLISCRNLLIYLDSTLQQRLFPLFHYALRPGGLLFLGSSESLGSAGAWFQTVDSRWKVFQRGDTDASMARMPLARSSGSLPTSDASSAPEVARVAAPQVAARLLLEGLVPPTVVIRASGEIVHVHGRTGRFLEPAPGPQPSANVFNMAREGLQLDLSAAVRTASVARREVVRPGLRVRSDGSHTVVDLRVRPVFEPEALSDLLLVTFEDARSDVDPPAEAGEPVDRLAELERELRFVKQMHQGAIEALEMANDELRSTNEELQSTNEELQSANEELETSKEEMQALNEELQTVNSELHSKVEQLSGAQDDLKNLLDGTEIATLFLDEALCIRRYTSRMNRILPLIPSDVGRPLADIASSVRYDDLVEDARAVLDFLGVRERQVEGRAGEWYLVRVLPYRTTENVIEGVVVTFVDVTSLRGRSDRSS